MGTPDQLFLQFAEASAPASYATGSPFAEAMADKTARQTFNYQVRENRRAKRIILRVTATHGLEVVVPSAAARRQIPEILAKNRTWIDRTLKKLCDERVAASRELRTPPAVISLPAVSEMWTVSQEHIIGGRPQLEEPALHHLHLRADLSHSSWQTLLRT